MAAVAVGFLDVRRRGRSTIRIAAATAAGLAIAGVLDTTLPGWDRHPPVSLGAAAIAALAVATAFFAARWLDPIQTGSPSLPSAWPPRVSPWRWPLPGSRSPRWRPAPASAPPPPPPRWRSPPGCAAAAGSPIRRRRHPPRQPPAAVHASDAPGSPPHPSGSTVL